MEVEAPSVLCLSVQLSFEDSVCVQDKNVILWGSNLVGEETCSCAGSVSLCGDHVWDKLGSDNHCVHLG